MMKCLSNIALSTILALSLTAGGAIHTIEAHAAKAKPTATAPAKEEIVEFNTHSYKYHKPDCIWAQRCTRNCISIPLSEAKKRGGVPCKVCGG